jgi:Na+/melibiose symporter-like transporter
VAVSKRVTRQKRASGEAPEKLDRVNLAVNAALAFGAGPAMFVLAYLVFVGTFGGSQENQHMFLGSLLLLIGLFFLLLSGLKVAEHVKARRRFRELLEGEQKSAIMRNLDELTTLARAMGPPYRRRLDARLDQLGIRR